MSWGSVEWEQQGMRSRSDGGGLHRALKNIIRTFDFLLRQMTSHWKVLSGVVTCSALCFRGHLDYVGE